MISFATGSLIAVVIHFVGRIWGCRDVTEHLVLYFFGITTFFTLTWRDDDPNRSYAVYFLLFNVAYVSSYVFDNVNHSYRRGPL